MLSLILPTSLCLVVAVTFYISYRRLFARFKSCYRELELKSDEVVQYSQGMILNVQGLISGIDAGHPVRKQIDDLLTDSNIRLAEMREAMQPLCSERQEDVIS